MKPSKYLAYAKEEARMKEKCKSRNLEILFCVHVKAIIWLAG